MDGKADFPGEATAFALSIGDADDVDRFDAYRIYDGMRFTDFHNLKIEKKRIWLLEQLEKLPVPSLPTPLPRLRPAQVLFLPRRPS